MSGIRTSLGSHASQTSFEPLTVARWPQLEALFGSNGACGNCWCMWWRHGNREHEAGKTDGGAGNRAALRQLAVGNPAPGILAFSVDDPSTAIGWCAVAPREQYPRMARSKVMAPLDAEPVWCISCLFVVRPWRLRGLSSALVAAAARYAVQHGATVVEGYPFEPAKDTAPPFIWTGTASAFLKAGFTEAGRNTPARPVMRWRP